jgi:secondary thiamine-phosphate synthase enzyme
MSNRVIIKLLVFSGARQGRTKRAAHKSGKPLKPYGSRNRLAGNVSRGIQMKIIKKSIEVQSEGLHPTFHNVTNKVKEIVSQSGISNGLCVIYSHHTTCSVMIQECSHDKTYFGLEFLQQDLCNIMEKLVPTCRVENQYMHPGLKHIEFALTVNDPPYASLNTDAHLRSCMFPRSETIVVENGKLDLGQFGYTYFIDWDQVRARKRTLQVTVFGE